MPFISLFGCAIVWAPTYLTYFASILLITLATMEKYYGICHPFKHRLVTGKGRTIRIIIFSWFSGALLSALVVLRYAQVQTRCVMYPDEVKYTYYPKHIQLCVSISETLLVFSEAVTVIPFFLALIGNVYMYGRIIYTLSHRAVTDKDKAENSMQIVQSQIRNQVARILIINGLVFFCCQFPYRLLSINLFVQEATGQGFLSLGQYGILAVIARCLVLVNSCANPFVYLMSSANYRQGFRQAFGCSRERKATRTSTLSLSIRVGVKSSDACSTSTLTRL